MKTMVGINIGSLSTSISEGKTTPTNKIVCEIKLSGSSHRTCPSQISFTNSHRLIGEDSCLVMKRYMKSTYANLIRYVGLNLSSEFYKKELSEFFLLGGEYNQQTNKFIIKLENKIFELSAESIIAGFLNNIKQLYFTNPENIDSYVFSVPDYFTCYQKDCFTNIIRSVGFSGNNVHFINESTAITLYFGYKKYKDYFVVVKDINNNPNKMGIDPTITKYVLFIDAGYAKTTFVLAQLTSNLFIILDSETMPFFGGRNLDDSIFNFCAKKFYEKTKIDITKNKKIKIRMLEKISKTRNSLTVGQDASLNFDSLADDEDFSYLLTRSEFEQIIQNDVKNFENFFANFMNGIKKRYPNVYVGNIEMAGELLRTPILQQIVKKIAGVEISKGILTDECIAVGCSLYGYIMKGTFPIDNFRGIYHLNNYTIYYELNHSGHLIPLKKAKDIIPEVVSLKLDLNSFSNQVLTISFYHDKKELEYYLNLQNMPNCFLIEYALKSEKFKSQFKKDFDYVDCGVLIDNNGYVHINHFKMILKNKKEEKLNVNAEMVNTKRGLYTNLQDKEKKENEIRLIEKELMKTDNNFRSYFKRKNLIEGSLYGIRDKILNKKMENVKFDNNCTLLECVKNIENVITEASENIIDLEPINQQLQNIMKMLTPTNLANLKNKLINDINNFLMKIDHALAVEMSEKKGRFNEQLLTSTADRIKYMKNQLQLCDENEFNQIQNSFYNETKNINLN